MGIPWVKKFWSFCTLGRHGWRKNFPAAEGGRQIFWVVPWKFDPHMIFFACPCMHCTIADSTKSCNFLKVSFIHDFCPLNERSRNFLRKGQKKVDDAADHSSTFFPFLQRGTFDISSYFDAIFFLIPMGEKAQVGIQQDASLKDLMN